MLKTYLGLTDKQFEDLKRFPSKILVKALKNTQQSEQKSYKVWDYGHRRKHFRECIKYYMTPKKPAIREGDEKVGW